MKKYIKLLCFALALALLTALIPGRIFAAGNGAPVNNSGSSGAESGNEFLIVGWRDKSYHEAVTSVRVNGVELLEYNPSPFDYAPAENVVSAPASGELSVEITLEDGYVLSNRGGSVIFLSGVQSATDAVTASESADSIVLPSAEWLENDEELYLSFTSQRDLQPGENPIFLDNIILKADKIDCGTEITDEMLPVIKTPSGEGYRAVPESACWAVYNGKTPADYFSPFTVSGSDSPVMIFDVISRGKYYYDLSQQLPAENIFIYNAKGAFDEGITDDAILSSSVRTFTTEGVTNPGPESTAQVICIPLKVDINHKSVIQEATDEALGLKGGPCSVCGEIEEDGMYLLKDTSPYKYPDGEKISDSGEVRTLSAVGAFDGSTAEVIIQDPLGVIPTGALLSIDGAAADPGRYYDGDYRVDSALNVSVSLKDTQGNRIPGLFTDYVRILIEIPDDWDEDELKTLDVNIYDDIVFADRIEYRVYDANGNFIRTADKDYQPAEGETVKKFAAFWTDNLGDFAVMDTLTDEEDFGYYKEEAKETADGLAQDGDSEEIQALIADAKDEIDALAYDDGKTLDENKAAVDAIIAQLEEDIADHRTEYTATFVDENGETVKEVKFTMDTKSIEEPAVPAKEGYEGSWTAYTLAAADITIRPEYTATEYTATFTADGETVKEVKFTVEDDSIEEPAVPAKEGYEGKWSEYTLAAADITIKAEYTAIEYTATFVDENGETVEEVKFTVETEKLDEPAVPEKTNYTGKWEEYTLGTDDITIKPIYTLGGETTVKAVDTESEITLGYKESKRFAFEPEFISDGATAHVFYNGEDRGEGTSIEVKEPTEDYTVECKVLDADGNEIATSGEIKVKVKNSFFDRLRWFFNNFWANILKTFIEEIIKAC